LGFPCLGHQHQRLVVEGRTFFKRLDTLDEFAVDEIPDQFHFSALIAACAAACGFGSIAVDIASDHFGLFDGRSN
jgi:hypothetical protein